MTDASRVESIAAAPTAPPRTTLGRYDAGAPAGAGRDAVRTGELARRIDSFTIAAIAIVVVGAALRLYTILKFGWDQDELYTIQESRDLFHTKLPPGINARPLYYLLQHPLLSVLAPTTVTMRMLPFLFGVAGLWATWLAGRRHVGRVGGLVAVFLSSVSIWHMEASGQARYYSLVYLCAALTLLWLPAAYDDERRSTLLGALAALVLGTLTHPSFVFPVVGVVLAVSVVTSDGSLRLPWPSAAAWRWLWGPFIVCMTLFYASMRLAHRQSALRNSIGRGDAATLRLLPAIVEWATPVVFGAALVAIVCLLFSRGRGQRRLGAIGLASVVVTFAALFVGSLWTAIYATYATALLPMLFVAAGALAEMVARGGGESRMGVHTRVAAAAIGLFGCALAPSVLSHLSDGTRFDYRPAYAQVRREAPDRPVIAWPAVLAQTYAPTLRLLAYRPERAYLDSVVTRYGDVWFVSSVKRAGIALDDTGDVEGWVAAHCRRRGAWERPRFDYRLYRVELYRCGG